MQQKNYSFIPTVLFLVGLSYGTLDCTVDNSHRAVVIVPVADLVGGAIANEVPLSEVEGIYENFPYAPDKGYYACLRMHQLKYNEIVVTKPSQTDNPEIECEVSNLFYLHGKKKLSRFWVLKKNLLPLSELENKIDISVIPEPIDMKKSVTEYNKNVLTLVIPWVDKKTKQAYSAGTRFVRCTEKDTRATYAFYYIDYAPLTVHVGHVLKKAALVRYPKTAKKKRELFVKLLKECAREDEGFIPYVYGGCSFTKRYKVDAFFLEHKKRCGRKVSFWQRKDDAKRSPKPGGDCSGMLLMAAQTAGIPYFCKNTKTLADYCAGIFKKGDTLENGDLLWYPGHVLVVSDIQKNLLIEAVGYDSGHGKAHETPISRVFTSIKTYDDLLNAYHNKRFLKRLNNKGKPFRSIYRLKILKLL